MERIPFLIAFFLLVNPFLEWIFRSRKIAPEKLQFWVMVTTGTAWVISLLLFLIDPNQSIIPNPRPGMELLPGLHFSFDWISIGLMLTAAALTFHTILTRQGEPRKNAWLAGMAGVCVIGLGSYSAYTLGLVWVILEGFHLYFTYQDREISTSPRKFLPRALIRLSAPAAIITLSLIRSIPGFSLFEDVHHHGMGPILICAGLAGFLGWFLSYRGRDDNHSGHFTGAYENWVPALMGLMLIVRGGDLIGFGPIQRALPLILSSLLFLTGLTGILFDRSPGLWFLGCGLMAAASAFLSGPESALSWGVLMVLPGILSWRMSAFPQRSLLLAALGLLGLLPVPLLPAWTGVMAFKEGLPGVLLGISYGILLGSILLDTLKNWNTPNPAPEIHPMPEIIGAAGLLISQAVICLRIGLIPSSQGLLGKSVLIWISFLGVIPVLVFGNHFPLKGRSSMTMLVSNMERGLGRSLRSAVGFVDQLVVLISRVFEGQAGLIWALLIGFLILTLISVWGG